MKNQFNSFTEFAAEIDRREAAKEDLIVPAQKMKMVGTDAIMIADNMMGVNEIAHSQIANKLNIPKKYYDAMPQIDGLREYNVNAWLENNPNNYMARTMDGDVRALLSDRYKPMDNHLLLQSFLPALNEAGRFEIKSSNLSETRMYLQVVFPNMEAAVKVGDLVQWGIVFSNSEVGHGAVDIKKMIWRLSCINGMIGSSILRKYHIGSRIGANESDYDLYADDTIQADMTAFRLKLRDTIKDATSEISFQNEITMIREAAENKITKPETLIKNVTKHFNLGESVSELILSNMVEDGNMNRWGLANGITALAHTIDNPDKQYEVEKVGSQIIHLKKDEWEVLSA